MFAEIDKYEWKSLYHNQTHAVLSLTNVQSKIKMRSTRKTHIRVLEQVSNVWFHQDFHMAATVSMCAESHS